MQSIDRIRLSGLSKAAITFILFVFTSVAALAQSATLVTDKDDYSPGETVTLFGAGFAPNEQIDLSIAIENPDTGEWIPDVDWTVGFADDLGGFVVTYVVPDHWADQNLRATAMGYGSARVATAIFTDHGPSPVTSSAFSLSTNSLNVVTVSVNLGGGSSTTTLTSAKAKITNQTDGNSFDVDLTGPGGNGNGTWSATFAGSCGTTYKFTNVAVVWTTTHDHNSVQTPGGSVTVTTNPCETSLDVLCPESGDEPLSSITVSATVSSDFTVNAGAVNFEVRNASNVVVGFSSVGVTGGVAGPTTVLFSPALAAGSYTLYAQYSGGTDRNGRTFAASEIEVCGFDVVAACLPVTAVTLDSPADGAVFQATDCSDSDVTAVASADGTDPVIEYSADGGPWQSSGKFNLGLGSHTLQARASNDCTTTPVVSSVISIWVKAATVLTLGTAPKEYITGTCERTFSATLKDDCGTPLAGMTVQFDYSMDGGTTWMGSGSAGSGVTDANGVATGTDLLNSVYLAPGSTVMFRAEFSGDDMYLPYGPTTASDTIPVHYAWLGVQSPLSDTITRKVKRGSGVPVKFSIADCHGNEIDTNIGIANGGVHTISLFKCSAAVPSGDDTWSDSGSSNSDGSAFRYSGTPGLDGKWIFNLNTGSTLLNWTYQVRVTLDDGSTHIIYITVVK